MSKYKNLRVFMMDSNKGTYIASNTIMSLAKYDWLLRFDADDKMRPNMIETLMKYTPDNDIITCYYKSFGRRTTCGFGCGQQFIRHEVFDKYGGYQPWICSADAEFLERVKTLTRRKDLKNILFDRRIHTTNLTVAKETNMRSALRKVYTDKIIKIKINKPEDAIIEKETNTYTEIKTS